MLTSIDFYKGIFLYVILVRIIVRTSNRMASSAINDKFDKW